MFVQYVIKKLWGGMMDDEKECTDIRMSFGANNGRLLIDIDDSYLKKIINNHMGFPEEIVDAAIQILQLRKIQVIRKT